MSWLKLFFEYIKKTALNLSNLDFIYIEWLISLIYPFALFLILLFAVPIVMITCMFGNYCIHWRLFRP